MALTNSEIEQIRRALYREPDWKQQIINDSVDAFADWLRIVLPGVARKIWDTIEDWFWRVVNSF